MPDYEEIIKQSQANVKSLSEKLKDLDKLHQEIKALKEAAEGIPEIFNKKFQELVKLSEGYTNTLGAATKNYLDGNNTLFTTKLSELSTKIKEFEKEITRLVNTDFTKLFKDLQKVFIDQTRADLAAELKRFEEKSKDLQTKIDELKKQIQFLKIINRKVMSKTILILGGGWGGLTAAHALRGQVPKDYRIAVIEKRQSFIFYPSFIRVIIGEKPDLNDVESPLKNLLRKDIEIINEEVISINPETRTVVTNAQTLQADYLIVAMGSELYPGNIPGFTESCLNLFDTQGAFDIHEKLKNFKKGKIAFLITRTPFRCPPAPYEAAMLTEWFLRQRGVRKDVEISIYTPEKQAMPVAGSEIGETFNQILKSRNINYYPEHSVTSIDGKSNKIIFSNNNEANYDLLIGVPPHGAPKSIIASGLTDSTGYIPVHPQTMQLLDIVEELTTRCPQVYAIGDNTAVRLLNGMMLPKAGVFAEEQANIVARNIAEQIKGEKHSAYFNGRGTCYVDVGDGMAAEGSGDFYAYPAPSIKLEMPSVEMRKAKHEFERIFEWWFSK